MKNSKRQSSLLNPRGQAVVEYVLMLVVSVAMVAALAYQIFRPMREFLKDYMGSYIACLLETGELPSLGNVTTEEILQEEGCNAKFQAATLKNGRPPNSSSGGSSNSAAEKNKNSASKGSEANSGGSGGSGSTSNYSSGQSTGRNLLTRRGRGSATDVASAGDGKTIEIPFEDSSSRFYNRRSTSENSNWAVNKRIAIGGMVFSDEEQKKQQRKENAITSMALPEGAGSAPKKIRIQKPERQIAQENEDESLTFGNFFRILLIAAIVIALVMVLGSQALKIVKSTEK